MIYPGTGIKWMVAVEMDGFSIDEDDMELTAVGSGTVDYTNRLPEEALEYDAVWMITRWEKKTASQS